MFESFATFEETRFESEAVFVAIDGKSHFTLRGAIFLEVPDFEQAHFAEAPRLDIAQMPLSRRLFSRSAASDWTARWRALKRLAVQGHDNERELLFFAEEIKAARGVQDRAFPSLRNLFRKGEAAWPGGARYWVGILYQAFSDFGRSMLRPLAWWWGSTVVFALLYLAGYFSRALCYPAGIFGWAWDRAVGWLPKVEPTLPALACLVGDGSPATSAFYLSFRRGLILPGLGDTDRLAQDYACLYGEQVFPTWVMYAGLGQTVFSAVLVFLLLLAVRNHFRIK